MSKSLTQADNYWLDIFSRYRDSGQSQRQYCESHDLQISTFRYYWDKLIKHPDRDKQQKNDIFTPVVVSSNKLKHDKAQDNTQLSQVSIELSNHITCSITVDLNSNQLSSLIKQLVASC